MGMHMDEQARRSILVIEDDSVIRTLIIEQLQLDRYHLCSASSSAQAREAIAQTRFDVIVLDLNLPDYDGLALCKDLRHEGCDAAIIMVTARDTPVDRILGLELGADDYLTKPFEPRELLARVRNLIRRLANAAPYSQGLRGARMARFGKWSLDLNHRRLLAGDGRTVMLSSSEYKLLMKFIESPDKVLSREELLPERSSTVALDRTLDLQISRLRHKLSKEPGGQTAVVTVRNEGYIMPGPVCFE
jgi:two-component system, OmpR family, response regulator